MGRADSYGCDDDNSGAIFNWPAGEFDSRAVVRSRNNNNTTPLSLLSDAVKSNPVP